MTLGGGMSCVKYLLFCFNLLFAVTGLIILIVGAKAEYSALPYVDLTDENFYTSGPVVLIIVGIIIFIVAFFGCCGAVKENHCMIVTFSVFLLMIFVAELVVGVVGYVKHQSIENTILKNLNDSIAKYPTDKGVQSSFDMMQTELHCCGINSPNDWPENHLAIPDTCCAGQEIQDGKPLPCTAASPNFHTDGCLDKLVTMFKQISVVMGGVGIGIACVQLLGVIFACCLARSIRSQYETV